MMSQNTGHKQMLSHFQGQKNLHMSRIEDSDLKQFVLNDNAMFPNQDKDTFLNGWFGDKKPESNESADEKDIDYELKKKDELEPEDTDNEEMEDWWGVEREGHSHDPKQTSSDSNESDDEGPDGGEMMPILDPVA